MKEIDLRKVYTPVPKEFRGAMQNATLQIRTIRHHGKGRTGALVAVLILLLAMGTGIAIFSQYSVRQYHAGGAPTEAFEANITEINEVYENDFITFSITDAIFDGSHLSVAVNVTQKNPNQLLFLQPGLTAAYGGNTIAVAIDGNRGSFHRGSLFPNLDGWDGKYGLSATVENVEENDTVAWTFTLQVLTTAWPVSDDPEMENTSAGIGTELEREAYLMRFQDAYHRQEILTSHGDSLEDYAEALPAPEGMDPIVFRDELPIGERLLLSGAFALEDTVMCRFDTKAQGTLRKNIAAGMVIPLEGYAIEVIGIDISFMQLSWTFDMVYPAGKQNVQSHALIWSDYLLCDEGGTPLIVGPGGGSMGYVQRNDGSEAIRYEYSVMLRQDIPSSIRFVPTSYQNDEWVPDEGHAFTVPLM